MVGEDDVVAIAVGGEEAVDAGGGEFFLGDDSFEEGLGVVVEFFGDFGSFFVFGFEDLFLGVPDAAEFPCVEEGGPVDVVCELAERLVFYFTRAGEFGDGWVVV